jgi:peptidoglycan hydrolase-like protein with peptidoglycan-binding domain
VKAARIGLLLGLLAPACGHTHQVKSGESQAPQADAGAPEERERQKVPERTRSETGTVLATSSAGLLKPGALRTIQQRLAKAGALAEGHETGKLDAATRAAVTHFQDAQGLPATGELDDATIEKLGLHPKDVFEAGGGKAK